jgi:hypothetical protein
MKRDRLGGRDIPVRQRSDKNVRPTGSIVWPRFLALAALAAGGCGDSRRIDYSVPALVKSLKEQDANLRYWAAKSLGSFGSQAESAVPDLMEALTDEHKMVRMGAAYALAEIGAGATEALPLLREAAKDPEPEVRDAASYASERIRARKKS